MFKKTSKKNTRRQKPRAKASKTGSLYFNNPDSVTKQSQVPFTLDYSDALTNMSAFTQVPIKHKLWGNGMRTTGRARLCALGHYYNILPYVGAILNPPSNVYYLQTTGAMGFNPHGTHSLRLFNLADTYIRYAYRSVRLVYIPRCASTQTGTVAVALYGDGGWSGKPSDYSTSYDNLTEIEGSISTSWRLPAVSRVTYTGDQTWFCNVNYENQAAAQLSHQYTLFAKTMDDVSASVTMGQLYMDYVIDFFQPTSVGTYIGAKAIPPNRDQTKEAETDSDPVTVKFVKEDPEKPATGPGGPAEPKDLLDDPDDKKPLSESKISDAASRDKAKRPNRQ